MQFSEVGQVATVDAAQIAWFRCAGSGPPVLMVHGTFSTHASCVRLADHLAQLGHDVWLFDWRGRGESSAPDAEFCFDDIALKDLQAVIDLIKARTGFERIHCVGHSGGGLVAAMWMARHSALADQRFASLTMIASQATGAACSDENRRMIETIADGLVDKQMLPAGSLGVGDAPEAAMMMRQWCEWNLSGAFHGHDGFDYGKALASVRVPVFALSAVGDTFVAPPHGCADLITQFGGTKEHQICGKDFGFSEDFDHGRIINSSTASQEVWPLIAEWIKTHD